MIARRTYALGGRDPGRIVAAEDAPHVAAILADAAARDHAVVPFGAGTLQAIGNAPDRYDAALDLRRLDAIRAYDHRDLTIGIDAGMTVEALTRVLQERGQFLPLDVPAPAHATVGGVLASGWMGPRRATYGRPRDLLIGAVAALADGTLAHAGGMVVKNVTGYDVGKLYVGSLGTLGIIVRANFKTLPKPPARRLATAPLADDIRDRAILAMSTLALEPSAALAIDGFGGGARLHVLFEGSESTVDRATREVRSTLGRAGVAETAILDGRAADVAFAAILRQYTQAAPRALTVRQPGSPSSVWDRARVALDAGAEAIADLRTGDVIARVPAHIDARVVLPAAMVIAGPDVLRARVDAWGAIPATIETMRALKKQFDPRGILAPGRFVGGI